MKRLICILLLCTLCLSGCNLSPGEGGKLLYPDSAEPNGTVEPSLGSTEAAQSKGSSPAQEPQTDLLFFESIPRLEEVGPEAYLAYFEAGPDYVDMGEYYDERNPFESNLAAEKQALGKNYTEYYTEQSVMTAFFADFVENNLDAYNEGKGLDDTVYLYLLPFNSMEVAMFSSFTEETDWQTLKKGLVMAAEMFGCTDVEANRLEAHSYTLSYTNGDGARIEEAFRADSRGIQMLAYKDGELDEFFEYISLGENQFLWQNPRERLILEYEDKHIYKAYYSYLPEEASHYTEADLVFHTDISFDPAWVDAGTTYHTNIGYDGTTLRIMTTNFFFGGIGQAEISPVTWTTYETN